MGQDPLFRARDLVAQMTLEEKVAYLGGDREFYIRAIERLGIPAIKMSDGPAGCRNWGPSTAYPAPVGIAATFDDALAEELGRSLARDCRARGVHILLAPGVNIQRSPLSGRNFEYFGEDPLLARHLATRFVLGVQGAGVLATIKHFALNNQEWDRRHVSSEVSERALREIYLPAFEGAVKDAHVGAVMTSYNLINGSYASHNAYLLQDILRRQWGFDGFVMSDWSAIRDTVGATLGGTDLEMPRGEFMSVETLIPLVEAGKLQESVIDAKVVSILRTLIRAGFFETDQTIPRPVDDPISKGFALRAARRAIVLLKNDVVQAPEDARGSKPPDAHFLPLDKNLRKIAVVGPNAHPAVHGGSGSAFVTPPHAVSLLEGIHRLVPRAQVVTHPGVRQRSGFESLGAPIFAGPVVQEVFLGKELSGDPVSVTKVDRIKFRPKGAPTPSVGKENYSIRWTGQIEVAETKTFKFLALADDGVRVSIGGRQVLEDWSDHAPRLASGEIELTPGRHRVVVEYFQGILGAVCEFGFETTTTGELFGAEELKAVVSDADVVIAAMGFGQSAKENSLATPFEPYWPPPWAREAKIVEAEDDDRLFRLPPAQRATLEIVTSENESTVVIGFAGGGLDFEPWLSKVPALIWAWYPGQEGGTALSEVLFGDVNPSGRLPVTFAREYSDYPSATSYNRRIPLDAETAHRPARLDSCQDTRAPQMLVEHEKSDGQLFSSPYCEGIFVGYRGFDEYDIEPLFPFGHGLSYTHFSYESLSARVDADGTIAARVSLTNSGKRKGREVIQIYVAPSPEQVVPEDRAPQQLAGYTSIELAPGESTEVDIPLSARAFSLYRPQTGWVLPAGEYEIRVSSSSRSHHRRTKLVLAERTEPRANAP